MLILTRRLGEVICIGDNVRVEVIGLRGHQVRLGITAPTEVRVYREEIYNAIRQQKETADE